MFASGESACHSRAHLEKPASFVLPVVVERTVAEAVGVGRGRRWFRVRDVTGSFGAVARCLSAPLTVACRHPLCCSKRLCPDQGGERTTLQFIAYTQELGYKEENHVFSQKDDVPEWESHSYDLFSCPRRVSHSRLVRTTSFHLARVLSASHEKTL
jgi:hypothetical protein